MLRSVIFLNNNHDKSFALHYEENEAAPLVVHETKHIDDDQFETVDWELEEQKQGCAEAKHSVG